MNLTLLPMLPLLAALIYLPGLLLHRLFQPYEPDLLECLYERVGIGLLLNGWLALLLAEWGLFSIGAHVGILLLTCLGAWWLTKRRAQSAERRTIRALGWDVGVFGVIGLLALALVWTPFEVILGSRDAGVYATSGLAIARTGSIVQYDQLSADLGLAAASTDPAVRGPAEQSITNILGVQHPNRFMATRMRAVGYFINEGEMPLGRVVPQFFHLFPVWIGLLASVGGVMSGLFAPGLLGFMGAWGVGMLARRLWGWQVGALAFLLLVLNAVQVWFSRYPTSETLTQCLAFIGLYAFAKWQMVDSVGALGRNEQGNPQSIALQPSSSGLYAVLAGFAFGQIALARIDSFLVIAPFIAYLGYCLLARRWLRGHTLATLALAGMLLHAALHIVFIARAYFFDTSFARLQDYSLTALVSLPFLTPALQEAFLNRPDSALRKSWHLWVELAVLCVGVGIAWLIMRRTAWVRQLEALIARYRLPLLWIGMVGLIGVAAYAYLVRPGILTPQHIAAMPGCLLPGEWAAPSEVCLRLQGYIGAPIELPIIPGHDAKYAIPLANFVRLGWYLSPLGIVLAVAGIAIWWRRGLTLAGWLAFVVGLLSTAFFVRDTYGTSSQTYIYILRRFLPLAYPFLTIGIAIALVALWQVAGRVTGEQAMPLRRLLAWLLRAGSAGATAVLLVFLVSTGLPIFRHSEYAGAVAQVAQTAQNFTPNDIVLFRGGAPTPAQARDIPDLIVTPLRFVFGVQAVSVKGLKPGSYADALAAQVQAWRRKGHDVYLMLGASSADLALPGFVLQPVKTIEYTFPEFEQLTDQKPRNVATLSLKMTLYRLVDGAPGQLSSSLPITADSFAAQIGGFYRSEHDLGKTEQYAWTDGSASLRVPWDASHPPRELLLDLAGGKRPAAIGPARVCLSLQAEDKPYPDMQSPVYELGCLNLNETLQSYRVAIPAATAALIQSPTVILSLQSPVWTPLLVDPQLHDPRALGVQFSILQSHP